MEIGNLSGLLLTHRVPSVCDTPKANLTCGGRQPKIECLSLVRLWVSGLRSLGLDCITDAFSQRCLVVQNVALVVTPRVVVPVVHQALPDQQSITKGRNGKQPLHPDTQQNPRQSYQWSRAS